MKVILGKKRDLIALLLFLLYLLVNVTICQDGQTFDQTKDSSIINEQFYSRAVKNALKINQFL